MKQIFKSIIALLLEKESVAVLNKYKPKIIAITGSVGKTSTKDAVYTALSRFFFVRKSLKNFNTEIGIPLTILDIPNAKRSTLSWMKNLIEGLKLIVLPNIYPEYLVLEVGADHPGDIKRITNWLKPDIVVITQLSEVPVHVEFFESPDELFKEKGNLVKALKSGGTLILNADDKNVLNYRDLVNNSSTDARRKIILFGTSKDLDISAQDYEIVYDEHDFPKGITFNIKTEGETLPVFLPDTIGVHHMYHCMAALSVCMVLGEHLSVAANTFKTHEPTPGRMRIIGGVNETLILDDTYNSSPIALNEALNSLRDLSRTKRKIVVVGDMLELGKYSIDAHKKAGEKASEFADELVVVGVRAKFIAEGAKDAGFNIENIHEFHDADEATGFMKDFIKKGDTVLVKGSQGMRMEKVVGALMAYPEDKENILVRQEKDWKNK